MCQRGALGQTLVQFRRRQLTSAKKKGHDTRVCFAPVVPLVNWMLHASSLVRPASILARVMRMLAVEAWL